MIYVDNLGTDPVLRDPDGTHLLNKNSCVLLVSIRSRSDFWPAGNLYMKTIFFRSVLQLNRDVLCCHDDVTPLVTVLRRFFS